MAITFYSTKDDYGEFANFAGCGVEMGGKWYGSCGTSKGSRWI